MENLLEQQKILSEIANIMFEESGQESGFSKLIFTTGENYQSPISMRTYFEYNTKYGLENPAISDNNFDHAVDNAYKLHKLMREQSGRAWSQMTLTLSGDGRLTTEFVYPDAK